MQVSNLSNICTVIYQDITILYDFHLGNPLLLEINILLLLQLFL
jgi:hypothetical protein